MRQPTPHHRIPCTPLTQPPAPPPPVWRRKGQHHDAHADASVAIALAPSNVKAYLRRAQAKAGLNDWKVGSSCQVEGGHGPAAAALRAALTLLAAMQTSASEHTMHLALENVCCAGCAPVCTAPQAGPGSRPMAAPLPDPPPPPPARPVHRGPCWTWKPA